MPLPLIQPMYFEAVLFSLENLLREESANQVLLGGAGFNVVRERFSPWHGKNGSDKFPLVNVSFNTGTFDQTKGNHQDQTNDGTFSLDCYAIAGGKVENGDVIPKDQRAADQLHHLISQVYAIVMSEINRDLGLTPGSITQPWVTRIEKFIPSEQNVPVDGIIAARLTLNVSFKETPPLNTGVPLEIINVESNTDTGGLVEQQFEVD